MQGSHWNQVLTNRVTFVSMYDDWPLTIVAILAYDFVRIRFPDFYANGDDECARDLCSEWEAA